MPATNFALLQWLVVDGIERCSLKTLLRRTRQNSPARQSARAGTDGNALSGMQAMLTGYTQFINQYKNH
jgi:hypothetical protein